MSTDTVIAVVSALVAVGSVAIGWITYRLALKQYQLSFEQWLAANEPWLRISFEHGTDEDIKGCFISGYPAYIRLQNQGKLPCQIIRAKLGGEPLRGRLRKSSISDTSIGGTLNGARMAPGETLYFRLSGTENLINRVLRDGKHVGQRIRHVIPIEIEYSYEPERNQRLKADVKLVASKKWTLMRVVDSSVEYLAGT